jgi:Xaa-Pro aminopeptidase
MRHDSSPYPERVNRLRAGISENDVLLVLHEKNIRYLTGFTGSDGTLMAGRDWLALLVDGRYTTQARGEAVGTEIFEFRSRIDGITSVAGERAAGKIGFESPSLTVADYLTLQEKLPGVSFYPISDGLQSLRAVKNEEEIALIRKAARIAGELEYRMRRGGAEQAAFETIVAAGANAALPHARPGCRAIADGDCVIVDYGAVSGGYHSDETCTYIVGHASERQREVYLLVREAHDRAIRAIRAGVTCGAIDRIARGFLEEAGLGEHFSHGTGHGVGLDVHEAPRLAAGREEILRAGMVVTIEPGIYLPGDWGIRIEDTVLVQEEGCEILTQTSKELTVL